MRQRPDDGRGQHGKTAYARQDRDAPSAGGFVERCDAIHEFGAIGQVEIVDATGDARGDQPVRILAVGLEWTGRIDDDVGSGGGDLGLEVAVSVEGQRNRMGATRQGPAKGVGLVLRAARNLEGQPGFVGQQAGQAAAKGPIAADDHDGEMFVGHPAPVLLARG